HLPTTPTLVALLNHPPGRIAVLLHCPAGHRRRDPILDRFRLVDRDLVPHSRINLTTASGSGHNRRIHLVGLAFDPLGVLTDPVRTGGAGEIIRRHSGRDTRHRLQRTADRIRSSIPNTLGEVVHRDLTTDERIALTRERTAFRRRILHQTGDLIHGPQSGIDGAAGGGTNTRGEGVHHRRTLATEIHAEEILEPLSEPAGLISSAVGTAADLFTDAGQTRPHG